MRKNILYILILVAIIGLFSPMAKIQASSYTDCITAQINKGVYNETTIATACKGQPGDPNAKYILLAPLPDGNNGVMEDFDPTDTSGNAFSEYLNLMIKLLIGICAVLSVIMIVWGGIEYMTSELPGLKSAGKERIIQAILGLLLALGAWTLLYTINPNLLNTDLKSLANVTVEVTITDFKISGSGALSRNGAPIKIDFNTQAYPAAAAAQAKTGVDSALTLAIFAQETGGGSNTGACTPANANMTSADQTALASIVGQANVATTRVSCSLSSGHGGAIGLTQFMPTTWNQYKDKAAGYLGHQPDPWNTNDALMMTAVYLQANGGATDPTRAAKAYFGSCNSGGVAYCDQVAAKTASLQTQITQAKKDGKIT